LKQSQNISETTTSIGLTCILHIDPTWAPCICWQRRRWTKLFGWNVTHCLKMHVLAAPKKKTMSMHAFNLLQSSNHTICCAHLLSCLF